MVCRIVPRSAQQIELNYAKGQHSHVQMSQVIRRPPAKEFIGRNKDATPLPFDQLRKHVFLCQRQRRDAIRTDLKSLSLAEFDDLNQTAALHKLEAFPYAELLIDIAGHAVGQIDRRFPILRGPAQIVSVERFPQPQTEHVIGMPV